MSEIKQRVILEKRVNLAGNGAWLSRDGNTITISRDYAGRLTESDQSFYADDIRTLAKFVEETEQSA